MKSFKESPSFYEDTVDFQVSLFAKTVARISIIIGFLVSLLPPVFFPTLPSEYVTFIMGVSVGIAVCGIFILLYATTKKLSKINWEDTI